MRMLAHTTGAFLAVVALTAALPPGQIAAAQRVQEDGSAGDVDSLRQEVQQLQRQLLDLAERVRRLEGGKSASPPSAPASGKGGGLGGAGSKGVAPPAGDDPSGSPASDPSVDPAQARIQANLNSNWQALLAALKAAHQQLPGAISINIEEDALHEAYDRAGARPSWGCFHDYDQVVKPANIKAKNQLKASIDAIHNAWMSAKSASKKLTDPKAAPWGTGFASVEKSVAALERVFRLLDEPDTHKTRKLQEFWQAIQDYAASLPAFLPPARADNLAPSSVHVRCIGVTIQVR